jgi:AraC-like DNA-binding protein
VQKAVFSSEELPAGLDDAARFKLWRDIYAARFGECEMSALPDRPFSARCEFARFGNIGVVQFTSTLDRVARTARQAAADPRGDILVGFNRGRSIWHVFQRGREFVCGVGQAAVFTNVEHFESRHQGDPTGLVGLSVPRMPLLELVGHGEDRFPSVLDANNAAAQHLVRYLGFLIAPPMVEHNSAVIAHIDTTIIDLVALSLGAAGDAAEIARGRGLRAARVQEILVEIKTGFAEPSFSARHVASKLGLSPRYVQELLQETELSFTERVMELRLQQARAMLTDASHDRLKVSDVALACGFNEVSYFNRCFRRRFGASPTQYRGAGKD